MALDKLLTNTTLLLLFIGVLVIPLLFIATELGGPYSTSSIRIDLRSFGDS